MCFANITIFIVGYLNFPGSVVTNIYSCPLDAHFCDCISFLLFLMSPSQVMILTKGAADAMRTMTFAESFTCDLI